MWGWKMDSVSTIGDRATPAASDISLLGLGTLPASDPGSIASATLDALSAHLAVLDESGTIVAVNRAWREFTTAIGPDRSDSNVCEGANYLRVCDEAAGPGSEEASAMAAGIRAVLCGAQSEFTIEYPCHSPAEERWFNASVTRLGTSSHAYVVVAHENITNQKQTEDALRRSEARNQALFNATTDAVMLLNETGFLDCNAATLAVFGCATHGEFRSKHPADLSPPSQPCGTDSVTLSNLRIREAMENGNVQFEWIHRRADTGATFAAEVLLTSVDLNGSLVVQAVVRDISVRKQAELAQQEITAELERFNSQLEVAIRRSNDMAVEAVMAHQLLLERENSLNEAQHLAHIGSWRLNTATNETIWSMELYHILGRDPSLSAPHWSDMSDIVDTEDWPRLESAFRHAIAEGEPCELEFRAMHPDGRTHWLWMISHATKETAGNHEWLSGTIQDITERKLAEAALRDSEAKLAEAMRMALLGAWEYDVSADRFTFNDQFFSLLGTTAEREGGYAMSSKRYADRFVHPDDRVMIGSEVEKAVHTTDPSYQARLEHRTQRADGVTRYFTVAVRVEKDADGRTVKTYGVNQDVTDRKQAEESLRGSEARYRAVTQSADDAIITADSEGRIVGWNHGAERVFGYTEAEISGRAFTELMPDCYRTQHIIEFNKVISNEDRRTINRMVEMTGLRNDGSELPVELSLSEWEVNGDRFFTGIVRDITARKAMEARMAYQANHDPLTNLPNRVVFQDRLTQALARCARSGKAVAVLFLDLDKFKLINDSLGHAAGDELLMSVAERIQQIMRSSDTAARFGGDEFTAVVEDVEDEAGARVVADRILAQFRRPFTLANREVFVNVSIGIALSMHWTDDPVDLMRKADAALYAAKRRGRGRCEAFGDHINAHSLLRLELESDLRLAVEREELVLHYQPIISLTTGEVKGLEALVRWNHPTRGIISPLDFIPVAEETGLILSIGRWIFHEACRQMQQWRKLYPTASDMYVSVNLSARQFQQPSLLGNVSRSLAEFDLPPSCVTLEITETVVMEETEFTLTTLAALKATGLRLAIDDFGTGYSSLSYLRRFPVDYLKIDRTFIDGLGRGSEDGLIVSSTIGLAHSLGLQVIAEGAETAEQVRLLCQLSCDNVQGYYFSQPLPAAEIELMLASAKAYPLPAGLAEPIGQTEQRKVEGAVCLEPDTQSRRVLTANVGAA
jgi:diguanylate cyclase (GGDEF)-like protein/PAS domain S-box-containing protein